MDLEPTKLTRAEVERYGDIVEHRIYWTREGHMPEDLPVMLRRLLAHAQATTKPRKRK